jgi:hypothetical protein
MNGATEPALGERGRGSRLREAAALVILLLATVPLWGVVKVPFIWADDSSYITENPDVLGGLSAGAIGRAFVSTRGAMWIPLTWLSFMLDVTLFGKGWGGTVGIHLTNLLLHAANGLLVYALLRQATRNLWRSLVTALLWVVHPLRVESVAWATERKDVLSLFFGLLALMAYVRYVRAAGRLRARWYAAVAALFACSLMAKPMMVTLPCVMVLLDVWPLGRASRRNWRQILVEKVPLLVMGVVVAVVTVAIPAGTTLVTTGQRGVWSRVGVALTGYVYYLRDTLWWQGLSFFYPLREVSGGQVGLAVLVLAGITGGAVWAFVKKPAVGKPVLVGWLWFVGAMVPTSGILQMGSQSRADRFTYYPAIGLMVALAWLVPATWLRIRLVKVAAGLLVAAIVVMMGVGTFAQVRLWQEPLKLYAVSAERTAPNFMMEFSVGKSLQDQGELRQAADWYAKSIESGPAFPLSHHNLATILWEEGHLEEAVREFKAARDHAPGDPVMEHDYQWAAEELARMRGAPTTKEL